MKILLVHNPGAGDDDHAGDHLVELVRSAGHEVEYRRSKDDWSTALDDAPELVVAAGGDGTVSEVARAAAPRAIPVTILPAGTANNIATGLGISDIPYEVLIGGWDAAARQPFDIGIAQCPWGRVEFLESVGLGALAAMMLDIEKGEARYVNNLEAREERLAAARDVLQRVIREIDSVRCVVEIDGRHVTGDYLLVEVLNFGAAGPNLHLAPDADGSDGCLDVVLVAAAERERLADHVSATGPRADEGPWGVHRGRRITLRCVDAALHLDDELWLEGLGREFTIDVGISPAVLTFLVPRAAVPQAVRTAC